MRIVVPRGLETNCRFRKAVLEEAARSLPMQKVLMQLCKSDFSFFVDVFCIGEGTLVLTDRGAVPIERVTYDDLVWDGEEWVGQDGPVYQGCKPVIFSYGIN